MLDRIFARIDDQQDDLIALTQDLVRIPTVNPPGEDLRTLRAPARRPP